MTVGAIVLVAIIDRDFERGGQVEQARTPLLRACGGGRLRSSERALALGLGLGLEQFGEALGLGQVDLAVEQGAAGEFAGLRLADAGEAGQRRQQRLDHRFAAMALKLNDILAGVAVGPTKCSSNAWSIVAPPAGSLSRRRLARRGAPSGPAIASATSNAAGPLIRTTAIAAGGRPLDSATIVSPAATFAITRTKRATSWNSLPRSSCRRRRGSPAARHRQSSDSARYIWR